MYQYNLAWPARIIRYEARKLQNKSSQLAGIFFVIYRNWILHKEMLVLSASYSEVGQVTFGIENTLVN